MPACPLLLSYSATQTARHVHSLQVYAPGSSIALVMAEISDVKMSYRI